MAECVLRLALTPYRSGKLFLIGLQEDGRLSISKRTFNCWVAFVSMGMGFK
tara:strand:+ start:234 stop:386 length:153 start_codon:yes stop_codon:yes gene_type:complete